MRWRDLLPLLAALPLLATDARADEGMWPFDMVPRERIQKEHQVQLTDAWLDHVRLATVRFNSGGTGSFVSARGLVLTNHHVASDCIAKLASAGHDFLATGYLAGKDGPEAKCPDLEIDELVSTQEVTARVRDAKQAGMSDADANRAMKGAMGAIEKECHDSTGLRCDVVTLYAGAMYHLYRYRRFTDVRLVFAPEGDIAFFGGDPDNFNYPRFDLDLALFRVYEGGSAVSPKEWLRWDPAGPKDGDVVFTSGNPGRTDRDDTMAQLKVMRDVVYPRVLSRLRSLREGLLRWSVAGPEEKREARAPIFGIENGLKALSGYEGGLRDAALMKRKEEAEGKVRAAVDRDAALKKELGGTWDEIARVQGAFAEMFPRYEALESGTGGSLLRVARTLVRLPGQRALANEVRLPEYRETGLEELSLHVLSPAPVYPGVEEVYVLEWLRSLQSALGAKDALVQAVLSGRTPERAAREMVAASKLPDVYARRALWDGGQAAVDASTDPLVVAMRALEPAALAMRKRYDDEVEAPMRLAGRRVVEATFAVEGTSVAPDATFTLRLSVGVVRGYAERGKALPWTTDFAGLYRHATGVGPLKLPSRWIDAKSHLTPTTPMNFVSTNDIIGGNSGSPVVSATGDLVGLLFDGNLPGLPNRFVYSETTARSVSVHTAAMLEALRVVYGAGALVEELSAR